MTAVLAAIAGTVTAFALPPLLIPDRHGRLGNRRARRHCRHRAAPWWMPARLIRGTR